MSTPFCVEVEVFQRMLQLIKTAGTFPAVDGPGSHDQPGASYITSAIIVRDEIVLVKPGSGFKPA
jgi:hypothetical protein